MAQGDQTLSSPLDQAKTPLQPSPSPSSSPPQLRRPLVTTNTSAKSPNSFIIKLLTETPLEAVLHQLQALRMVSHH